MVGCGYVPSQEGELPVYRFEASLRPDFSVLLGKPTETRMNFATFKGKFAPGMILYWRVRATHADGTVGEWSNGRISVVDKEEED